MKFAVGVGVLGCAASLFAADIVVENEKFRLTVGEDAVVKSLVMKWSGEECVDASLRLPLVTATQDRPYCNEVKLIHPNKKTTYPAVSLRQEGNLLIAGFDHKMYEVAIAVKSTPSYVAFVFDHFISDRETTYAYLKMDIPPVKTLRVLELPVKGRKYFGDWLNACWDESTAIAVVGLSTHTDIDHEKLGDTKVLFGELDHDIKMKGCGVAIVAAPGKEAFLDAMDALERDYDMPRGVASRRNPVTQEPIFHLSTDFSPAKVDKTIEYMKKGGFKLVTFGQYLVTEEIDSWGIYGNYDLSKRLYPNGIDDLKAVLKKFHDAGMKVGLHTLHTHIGLKSRYVTPVADARLGKLRKFTLVDALPKSTNDIAEVRVHEPTEGTVMFPARRILQFGGELLSYESYTTEPPYKFLGVKRCAHNTLPQAHEAGQIGGILDISEYGTPMSCYFDQNTDLQDEIAEKIAKFYNCGFDYVYLDGSEGVHAPFNYHVANAQLRFWKHLKPEPLFGEGAAKTHFGWHMLAGANAFDYFRPRLFEKNLRRYPFKQAPIAVQEMTRVDFGWWRFWHPNAYPWDEKNIGTQADMWEYGASVAAAWDCAISILMPLDDIAQHKRADDILETMRKWGDCRRRGLLKDEWRPLLKDVTKKHHLIDDGKGGYDLVVWELLSSGEGDVPLRALAYERDGETHLVYWHIRGEGEFTLGNGLKLVAGNMKDEVVPYSPSALKAAFQNVK